MRLYQLKLNAGKTVVKFMPYAEALMVFRHGVNVAIVELQ